MDLDTVTEEERAMLKEAHAGIVELKQALLGTPVGSSKDDRPLLEDLRVVVAAYKKASWVTRAVIYLLPTLAGLGVAYQTVRSWWPWQ